MCSKTNWKLKCGRALRLSMINLWRMLKILIEVKSVGAKSNKSVDKAQCSAQELLHKWWYCYHVLDTMSCWAQHVPLCFILHTPVPETLALLVGELLYTVCDVSVSTQSAHCTLIWSTETACVVISWWNTHTQIFYWFYDLNSILYTGCPRRNVPDFGRVFLMLKYTDITQNTYVQSWTVTEIMAREVCNFDSCYILKVAGICGFCNVNICT